MFRFHFTAFTTFSQNLADKFQSGNPYKVKNWIKKYLTFQSVRHVEAHYQKFILGTKLLTVTVKTIWKLLVSLLLSILINTDGKTTKKLLYGHLPPITRTIKVRRTRYAGHWWRSGDELISDVLLWTSSHGQAKAG